MDKGETGKRRNGEKDQWINGEMEKRKELLSPFRPGGTGDGSRGF